MVDVMHGEAEIRGIKDLKQVIRINAYGNKIELWKLDKIINSFEAGLRKLGEFNALKERKIELRNDKHKGKALKFPYCFDHLKAEYEELLKAKKAGDKKKIAEELADLSNMCEFTFLALKSEEHLQISGGEGDG